jgi:hypothetical protein
MKHNLFDSIARQKSILLGIFTITGRLGGLGQKNNLYYSNFASLFAPLKKTKRGRASTPPFWITIS